MFITSKYSGYNQHGEQSAAGLFLILMTRKGDHGSCLAPGATRAVVRYVRMTQLGHFMMGSAQIGPERVVLSGGYGNDGLPTDVSDAAFERGVDVPEDLMIAWNTGGGHNGAGSEADMFRQWAHAHMTQLRGKATLMRDRGNWPSA